jgi:hypothetical protein
MMAKFANSPVSADTVLASKSTITKGFLKRDTNCLSSECLCAVWNVF